MAKVESPPTLVQYYRRPLPDSCLSFSSERGKTIFKESLAAGFLNIYFPLAEQFRTQDEPAYCGISTLVMVLNTLAVDPKRIWKGPWRWYHENMLDCCMSLDVIQQNGITLEQFVCLAACNNLDVNAVTASKTESVDDFRNVLKEICVGTEVVLACAYSREVLGQTGDGHFSPIGAYHQEEDLALIFDVARFKYPPYWVKVELLWKAMRKLDSVTGLPRGYVVMQKTKEMPLLLFRLANLFRVTIGSKNLSQSPMAQFINTWLASLSGDCSGARTTDVVLANVLKSLSMLTECQPIFTTQFNTCCIEVLPSEYAVIVQDLLRSLEALAIYRTVNDWVAEFIKNQDGNGKRSPTNYCCTVDKIGKSEPSNGNGNSSTSILYNMTKEDKRFCPKQMPPALVSASHYITMFLLSWPYESNDNCSNGKALRKLVEISLKDCPAVLTNEVNQLRMQIESIINLLKGR